MKYEKLNKTNAELVSSAMVAVNQSLFHGVSYENCLQFVLSHFTNCFVLFDAQGAVVAVVTVLHHKHGFIFETAWLKRLAVDERESIMRDFEGQVRPSLGAETIWWSGC